MSDGYQFDPVQRVPPVEAVYFRDVYIGEITYQSRSRASGFVKDWGWRPMKATRAPLETREEAAVRLRAAWERRFGPVDHGNPSPAQSPRKDKA